MIAICRARRRKFYFLPADDPQTVELERKYLVNVPENVKAKLPLHQLLSLLGNIYL